MCGTHAWETVETDDRSCVWDSREMTGPMCGTLERSQVLRVGLWRDDRSQVQDSKELTYGILEREGFSGHVYEPYMGLQKRLEIILIDSQTNCDPES